MWAWIMDQRSPQTRQASAWSGELSLPRVLWLGKDKTLRMAPAEELATLRYEPQSIGSLSVAADADLPLPAVSGNAFEMEIEMLPDKARQFGVKVCCSPGGEEQTLVFYDADEKKLKIDTTRSSLGEGPKKVEGGPLTLEPGEPLKLRVFVDKSVIEVFANDRQAVMRRIYPSRGDALGVVLFSRGGTVKVPSLGAWQMSPANPY
jgi:beta-fructofuranosidase